MGFGVALVGTAPQYLGLLIAGAATGRGREQRVFTIIATCRGFFYSLATLVFRWPAVVAKYGSLSLYWWITAVTIGWGILGFVADAAIWGVATALYPDAF